MGVARCSPRRTDDSSASASASADDEGSGSAACVRVTTAAAAAAAATKNTVAPFRGGDDFDGAGLLDLPGAPALGVSPSLYYHHQQQQQLQQRQQHEQPLPPPYQQQLEEPLPPPLPQQQPQQPPPRAARVPVACGALRGVLLLPEMRIAVHSGTPAAALVSPTEFERLGGRGRVKKWRLSVMRGARRAFV